MYDEQRLAEYKVYEDLTNEEFNLQCDYIVGYWKEFLSQNAPMLREGKDYYIHRRNLFETVRRIDKRRVYYKVFHDLGAINELKYVALLCYWINTLKPFMVVKSDSPIYNAPNEMFSMFLIISTIREIFERIYPDREFEYPSDRRITDIVYNFKYCDLSREATIAFVETFADIYGVGIQYILNKNEQES